MNITTLYNLVYADHQYLWNTYGPAHDMSGGYEDQNVMQNSL